MENIQIQQILDFCLQYKWQILAAIGLLYWLYNSTSSFSRTERRLLRGHRRRFKGYERWKSQEMTDPEVISLELDKLLELEKTRLRLETEKRVFALEQQKVVWDAKKNHLPVTAQKWGLWIAAALLLFPGLRRRIWRGIKEGWESLVGLFKKDPEVTTVTAE